jgi:hypothetical protein
MKEISVEFRFTPDEAVLAAVEITKCVFKKFNTFLPWTGAFLLLINIPVLFAPTHFPGHMFIPVIAGVICIAVPYYLRWAAVRSARKLPNLYNTIKWNISESELSNATEGEEATFVWDKITKIQEREKGFLLFPHPSFAFWIPKRGFQSESDIELFREIANSKHIDCKSWRQEIAPIKKKVLIGCGTSILIFLALIASLIVIVSIGPDTSVYPGHRIPKKYISTIRSLNLLQEDEDIRYFYSDAFVDIKKGLYFVTDQHLVLYSSVWQTPKIIIHLDSITTIETIYGDESWDDTMVHISISSGENFSFPVSSEGGFDEMFVDAMKQN